MKARLVVVATAAALVGCDGSGGSPPDSGTGSITSVVAAVHSAVIVESVGGGAQAPLGGGTLQVEGGLRASSLDRTALRYGRLVLTLDPQSSGTGSFNPLSLASVALVGSAGSVRGVASNGDITSRSVTFENVSVASGEALRPQLTFATGVTVAYGEGSFSLLVDLNQVRMSDSGGQIPASDLWAWQGNPLTIGTVSFDEGEGYSVVIQYPPAPPPLADGTLEVLKFIPENSSSETLHVSTWKLGIGRQGGFSVDGAWLSVDGGAGTAADSVTANEVRFSRGLDVIPITTHVVKVTFQLSGVGSGDWLYLGVPTDAHGGTFEPSGSGIPPTPQPQTGPRFDAPIP